MTAKIKPALKHRAWRGGGRSGAPKHARRAALSQLNRLFLPGLREFLASMGLSLANLLKQSGSPAVKANHAE